MSGAPIGFEPIEVADGTLEPDRRRMQRADRRKCSVRTFDADDGDVAGAVVEQRHVHGAGVAPQAEQRQAPGGEFACDSAPGVRHDDRARPRTMAIDAAALRDDVGECRHAFYPSSFATFWNQTTSAGGI